MSLIIPANTLASGGFAVDNSLRFNDGSSDNLSKTFGTNNGEVYKWTYSFWVKRSSLGEKVITASRESGTNNGIIRFTSGDALEVYDYRSGMILQKITSRLFRDFSAWYNIVISNDNSVASPDTKIYINGVEETSFSTDNEYSQNERNSFNSNYANYIGQTGASSQYFDGYISESVFIDGTALDATSFGEFDEDSGIWKPIDVSGLTFGTNGFYLDFEDSGALGDDVSGNGNDFTVNNLTAIDQTTDTPTNNFATMNPLDTHSSATLSEGNTGIATTASGWFGGSGTMGITLGQPAYFEAKAISSARLYFGLSRIGQGVRGTTLNNGAEGDSNFDYMWRTTTANTVYYGGSNQSITIGAISANDICACSVASDGEVKFYLNDSTVVTFSTTLVAGYFYFPILSANAFGGGTESWLANFGNPAYAITSGNQDANGYGNFEYSTKGGYALNTKNLSEYG